MATLRTVLTMDLRGFQSGLRAASRSVARFNRDIGRPLAAGIRNLTRMAAAAAAVGIAIAGWAVTKVTALGDQLDKMAKRTGFGVEELSRLAYAAELSGTSLESVEKAVKRMAATVYDLGLGLSTSVDAFDALGLSMADVAGKSPSAQFAVITDALADIKDASLQAALAQRVFGRAGTMLLPLLKSGAAGMQAMRAEADRLGIVFNPEDVRQAALFRDNLTRVKAALMGLARSAIGLEGINRTLRGVIEYAVQLRDSKAFAGFVQGVRSAALAVANLAGGIAKAIGDMVNSGNTDLLKFAAGFAVVALAFQTGLAIPLLKVAAMIATGLVSTLFSPVGTILAAIAAMIASYQFGEALRKSFDLGPATDALAAAFIKAKGYADKIAAIGKNIGHPIKTARAFKDIQRDVEETLALLDANRTPPTNNGLGLKENFKAELGAMIKDATEAMAKLGGALIPDSVKEALDTITNFKIDVPELKLDAAGGGIGAAVEAGAMEGIKRGMSDEKWGRVFVRPERGKESAPKLWEKTARASVSEAKKTNLLLERLSSNGRLIFA